MQHCKVQDPFWSFFKIAKTPTYTHSVEWIHTNKNVLLKQNHFQLLSLSQPGRGGAGDPDVWTSSMSPWGCIASPESPKKNWSELQDLTGEWELGLNVSWRFQHLHYLKLRYKSRCFFSFVGGVQCETIGCSGRLLNPERCLLCVYTICVYVLSEGGVLGG